MQTHNRINAKSNRLLLSLEWKSLLPRFFFSYLLHSPSQKKVIKKKVIKVIIKKNSSYLKILDCLQWSPDHQTRRYEKWSWSVLLQQIASVSHYQNQLQPLENKGLLASRELHSKLFIDFFLKCNDNRLQRLVCKKKKKKRGGKAISVCNLLIFF